MTEETPAPETTPDPAPAETASESAPPSTEETPAAAATATEPEPEPRPVPRELAPGQWCWGTGRRKRSVARVRIRPGKGDFIVNKRPHEQFFPSERDQKDLMNVLEKTRMRGAVDVHVNVHGGGVTGQAGAIILGLARALLVYDFSLDSVLRDNNFLTRDPRQVERKKYGQPGARARFQFSKR